MFVYEKHVMLEARVKMRLESKMDHDRVVVTVDVRVDAVETLEDLANGGSEGFWKANANPRGKHGFIVDIGLDPGHEVLDVFRRWHFGRTFVVFGILPEVFESI